MRQVQFFFILIIIISCNSFNKNIPISSEAFVGKYFFVDKDNIDSLEILSSGVYKHTIVDNKKNKTLLIDNGKWWRNDETQFILDNYRFLNMQSVGVDFRPYYGSNNNLYIDMTIDGSLKYKKIK